MGTSASSNGVIRGVMDRWLFRLGQPETGPVVLTQRRIYVLPTAAGYAFAGGLLVMLIAAINYNLSLGYALTFLLGGVAVASIVHAFRNLLHLSVRGARIAPVFCGDNLVFRLLIDNRRATRRPALRLIAHGEHSDFDLAPNAVTDVSLAVPTSRRGVLPIGRVVLETRWPLGLIRAWSVFVLDVNGLVYPAPEAEAPELPEQNASDARGRQGAQAGDDDFAGLRKYQPSDSLHHTAWKVVARGGPMMTKQFSSLLGGDVTLAWSDLPATLDDEARLSRLAAWLLIAERGGRRYELRLPSHQFPRGRGSAHMNQCLRALALYGSTEKSTGNV